MSPASFMKNLQYSEKQFTESRATMTEEHNRKVENRRALLLSYRVAGALTM